MESLRTNGMKAKTIKAVLTKKMDKWLATIEDETLRNRVSKNVIITGGSIVSMLQGEPVNDFDVYFRDYETTRLVTLYYVKKFTEQNGDKDFELYVDADFKFNKYADAPQSLGVVIEGQTEEKPRPKRIKIIAKSAGVASTATTTGEYKYFEAHPDEQASEYIKKVMDNPGDIEDTFEDTKMEIAHNPEEQNKFRPVFLSSNAITLSDKLQIILRFYGEPEEIHANYDFVHCTSHWQSWDHKLVLRPEALESILCKDLRYVGSKYPICSIVRLRKFIQRGWRINAGQILKMCMQISELDLASIEVIEDQLTGVDTAYFVQLISNLKENDPEKVNAGYLIEIIDRLFA